MPPSDRVAQLYPQALGSLFVTFYMYDSQGYSGVDQNYFSGIIRVFSFRSQETSFYAENRNVGCLRMICHGIDLYLLAKDVNYRSFH
jgi:hypothetical protein